MRAAAVQVAGFAGLLAGYLSDRMGLVRTMVLTHLPSRCAKRTDGQRPHKLDLCMMFRNVRVDG